MKIIGDRQKQAAKTIFDRSSTKIGSRGRLETRRRPGAGVGNVLRFVAPLIGLVRLKRASSIIF